MLSIMENMDAALRLADRAAAAPFIRTPRIPVWYPFAMAVYYTVVAGTFPLLRDGQILLGAGLLLVALAVVLLVTMRIRSRWGTWPRLSQAPREIKGVFVVFVLLALSAFIVSAAVWVWVGTAGGLITVFSTMLVLVWAYEFRLYPGAAARVRGRLA